MSKRYDGRPVQVHVKISGLDKKHFECWLDLFRKTAVDFAPPEAALIFIDRAERIAQSLLLSIDYHRGVLPELKAPIRAGWRPSCEALGKPICRADTTSVTYVSCAKCVSWP